MIGRQGALLEVVGLLTMMLLRELLRLLLLLPAHGSCRGGRGRIRQASQDGEYLRLDIGRESNLSHSPEH